MAAKTRECPIQADFVALWGEGENSFAIDPPNAVLAFVEAGAPPADAAVVINEPMLEDEQPRS